MEESNRRASPPINDYQYPEVDIAKRELYNVYKIISGKLRTVSGFAFMAVVAAVLYLCVAPSRYTASALIVFDPKIDVLRTPSMKDSNAESASLDSQIEIMRSEQLMRDVVVKEQLAGDASLSPGLLIDSFTRLKSLLTFHRSGEGDPNVPAARALQKLTWAKRLGLSYAVEVSATMLDPNQAAKVANAYAQSYIDAQIRLREDLARRASAMLQKRTDELQTLAIKAERAVEQLKFSGSLEGVSSANARVELKNLESEANTYRILHDRFLERYAETWQQQYLSMPEAQIASAALPPQSRSSPSTLLVLSAALFMGVALGLIWILVEERWASAALLVRAFGPLMQPER